MCCEMEANEVNHSTTALGTFPFARDVLIESRFIYRRPFVTSVLLFLPLQRATPRTSGPKASGTAKGPAPWFTLSEGGTPTVSIDSADRFYVETIKHGESRSFRCDWILLLKPLKLNHARMFTSEVELQ